MFVISFVRQLHGTLLTSCGGPCPFPRYPCAHWEDTCREGWWQWVIGRRCIGWLHCHHITCPSQVVGAYKTGASNRAHLLYRTNSSFRYENRLKFVHSLDKCVAMPRSHSLSSSYLYELDGHQCSRVSIEQSNSKRCVHTQCGKTMYWLNLIHAQAIMRFTSLADDSNAVPKLRNKKYSWFRLSKLEWDEIKLLHEVMQVCHCVVIPHALLSLRMLTTSDRNRQQHNNHSRNHMSLLSGAQFRFSNSCNRLGRIWLIHQSSTSSEMRSMVAWRMSISGTIKLTTQTRTSFA